MKGIIAIAMITLSCGKFTATENSEMLLLLVQINQAKDLYS